MFTAFILLGQVAIVAWVIKLRRWADRKWPFGTVEFFIISLLLAFWVGSTGGDILRSINK